MVDKNRNVSISGVSNDIVKRHGGQMNIRSKGEGKGAAIEIKLPLFFKEPTADD
ncbi:MAG: hypothetical protein QME32_07100 [Endomicrobiia bacterium]|nr:hypothetical protein [Endomicrobiia bacterium]